MAINITITAVKDLAWADSTGEAIDCVITTSEYGDIPFTAAAYDTEPHGVHLFDECKAGKYGPIAAYVPPAATAAALEADAQNLLDSAAVRKGYANAAACVSYLNSTNATWASDASAMNKWRDDAWAYVFAQEKLSPLPDVATLEAGINGLSSNPGW